MRCAGAFVLRGPAWTDDDQLHLAFDEQTRAVWFGHNGRWLEGNPDEGLGGLPVDDEVCGPPLRPLLRKDPASSFTYNFGQRPLRFTPPSDFVGGFGAGCAEVCG